MASERTRPSTHRYDAVVVGARCAGASTAMLLARHGLSVLLVDRDRRGADTLSTLALMRAGVLQLHRWGVLDAVRDAGTPPIRSTSFVYGEDEISIPIEPRDGVESLFAPRRTVLDAVLADAAAAAGADVLHGPRLVDLLRGAEGRVRGAVIQERGGTVHEIAAGIVVGADGLRSTVARLVDAPVYRRGKHACGVVYAFWPGLENRGNRWHYRPGVAAGAIPTNDGDTCIFAGTTADRFRDEIRIDIAAGFRRIVAESSPALADELDAHGHAEKYRGFPGVPGTMRRSQGPGWALVGDAGYFKDPITAHGISDALRDAELLARAIVHGTERALADYQATRDELSTDLFEITDAIAGFEWDLDRLQTMHMNLSKTMNHEVKALLSLDEPSRRNEMSIDEKNVDNGVNVEALLGARQALTEAPEAASFTWRAKCEWVRGTHSRSTVEGFFGLGEEQKHKERFSFEADHPEIFASEDHGATPVEIVLAGLASCLTAGVAAVAQHRQIQLRSVSATLEGGMDIRGILGVDSDVRNGFDGIKVTYRIDADATPDEIRALVAQSQKRSAVYDIITNPTNVSVEVA